MTEGGGEACESFSRKIPFFFRVGSGKGGGEGLNLKAYYSKIIDFSKNF